LRELAVCGTVLETFRLTLNNQNFARQSMLR
jgi:hypothetical protein